MSEFKNTPGPWFNGTDPRQIESSIDGTIVATVSGALSNESVLADALLIAAAPEMLESLQKALSKLEENWYRIDHEWGPEQGREFGDLEGSIAAGNAEEIKILRHVIAKATGEHNAP